MLSNRMQGDNNTKYLYQSIIVVNHEEKRFLRKPIQISMPFTSNMVFTSETDALNYIPIFCQQLVAKGAILESEVADSLNYKTGVIKLTIGVLERVDGD